jgi:cholesterol oxidase
MKLTIFKHVAVLYRCRWWLFSICYLTKSTFFKTGSWSKLHDLENELAPYYEEALRMPGGAKNPKLFDGAIGLESNSKIGNG